MTVLRKNARPMTGMADTDGGGLLQVESSKDVGNNMKDVRAEFAGLLKRKFATSLLAVSAFLSLQLI
jgi:hypothetical protein